MKLKIAMLLLVLCPILAKADPITLNLSAQPGGYTVPDGSGNPCAVNLNCGNGTPRGRDWIIRDAGGNTLSTITFNLGNASSVTLDTGQSATVNLGTFAFSGALPQGALDYNFLLIVLGANSQNGFMASLSFAADGMFVRSGPQSPQGLNSLFTLGNGTRIQVTSVSTNNGTLSVLVTNLGNGAEVPEPMTLVLLGSGLAGLAALRRRRLR